jgi:Peptidase family M23
MRARFTIAVVLAVLLVGWRAPVAVAGWRAPTSGEVTRGFALAADPFAPGQHRGADFAAPPGAPVRAACAGRVVVAERIGASGGVVTVACGPWRVSHLPLATITARLGARLSAGAPIGTAAPSRAHDGIHLGVRRAGDPFGYVDPLRFIHPGAQRPPAGPPATPRRPPRRRAPRQPARPVPSAHPAPVSSAHPAPIPSAHSAPFSPADRAPVSSAHPAPFSSADPAPLSPGRPLAPWPVWAGLGVLLLAVAGRGVRVRTGGVRTRRPGTLRGALATAARTRDHLPP